MELDNANPQVTSESNTPKLIKFFPHIIIGIIIFLIFTAMVFYILSPESVNRLIRKPTPTPEVIIQKSTCEELRSSEFQTIQQYEVGQGPNGLVLGFWSIKINDNKFEWRFSDMVEQGTVICEGNQLIFKRNHKDSTALYNLKQGVLVLEDVDYKKIK